MTATQDDGGRPPSVPAASEETGEQPSSWLDRIRHRLGFRSPSIREDLEDALAETGLADGFSAEERIMLRNILALRGTRVEDVMVPRPDIQAVPSDITLAELLQEFETAGHSRLPVYQETLDDPRGFVHIKDLVGYITRAALGTPAVEGEPPPLHLGAIDLSVRLAEAALIRPVLFVPGSMPAIDLLASMKGQRVHIALVIDEYGGTDGLVSIEDLVEMVVGEIEDEYDEAEEPEIAAEPNGSWIATARVPLEDVVALIGDAFDVGEAAEEVDTLGGLLVTLLGRVPVQGEIVAGPDGWRFEVLDADPRRVKMVRIVRSDDLLEAPAAAASPSTGAAAALEEAPQPERRAASRP